MRVLICGLLLAVAVVAQQQSVIVNAASHNVTLPAAAPWNAMGSFRLEMRIHNMAPTGNGYVWHFNHNSNGDVGFQYYQSHICSADWADFPSGIALCSTGTITGQDLVIRFQRDVTNSKIMVDVFNYATGALMVTTSTAMVSNGGNLNLNTGAIGSTAGTEDIAWIKWYSTLVPSGTTYPYQSQAADLADIRFEGALTDTDGALTISNSGSWSSYTTTPIYTPICSPGVSTSFRQGFPITLDGSASRSADESPLGYAWTQAASALTDLAQQPSAVLSSSSVAQPSVTGALAGYSFDWQLVVTDSGDAQTATCVVNDGIVKTDSNGTVVVSTGSAAFDNAISILIGAQPQLGKNPWLYYDQAAQSAAANQIASYDLTSTPLGTPAQYQPWWNTAAAGTVTVTTNGSTITGAGGANFESSVCDGSGNPTGGSIVVWYLTGRTVNGVPETGKRIYNSGSNSTGAACTSSTVINLAAGCTSAGKSVACWYPTTWGSDATPGSGLSFAVSSGSGSWWASPGNPANYYDHVQMYYELYFRSGIDLYLVAARNLADRFWASPEMDRGMAYAVGNGFAQQQGRSNAASGMILRAFDNGDGNPDMWAGLHKLWAQSYNFMVTDFPVWSINAGLDARETGYVLAQLAYCALFDQDNTDLATGNITYRQYCRNAIKTSFQAGSSGVFPKNRDPGQLGWLQFISMKGSYATGHGVDLINGATTATCHTPGTCGWAAADFTTKSASGLTNYVPVAFTDSASTFPADSTYVDAVPYCATGCTFINANSFTLDIPYQGTTGTHGWIMGTSGGALDSNTSAMAGWGQDSFMEGIIAWAFGIAGQAMACTSSGVPAGCDNTTSSLAYSYMQDAVTWIQTYAWMPSWYGSAYFAGFPACGATLPIPTNNTWCARQMGNITAREIYGDAARGVMAAYQQGTTSLQTNLDAWYAGMWAKPGVATNPVASPDGSYDIAFDSTGCTRNATWPIYSCSGNGYYLSGSAQASSQLGMKETGQHFGISNQASWPVARVGGMLTQVPVSISFRLADITNATSVAVTWTEPSGATSSPVICTSSPCAITVSLVPLASANQLQLNYRNVSGTTIATGTAFALKIGN